MITRGSKNTSQRYVQQKIEKMEKLEIYDDIKEYRTVIILEHISHGKRYHKYWIQHIFIELESKCHRSNKREEITKKEYNKRVTSYMKQLSNLHHSSNLHHNTLFEIWENHR